MFRTIALCAALLITAPALAAEDKKQSRNQQTTGQQKSFTCGTKTKCDQMENCEEAQFYLKTCKVQSLDRDKDGVPCESLCKK